jgi:hypothetical protein
VSIFFVLGLAVTANLAWATAIRTTGPWYDGMVSLAVYSVAIVVATLLATSLAVNAARAMAAFGSSLRRVDRQVALVAKSRAIRAPPKLEDPGGDDDLDAMLESLGQGAMTTLVRLEKEGHDTLVPLPAVRMASRTDAAEGALSALISERTALREAQARVWSLVAPALLACLAFLAVACPMLPGSGSFATTHFQLNTALALFLSYGLPLLVAWAVLVLAWVSVPSPRPAK